MIAMGKISIKNRNVNEWRCKKESIYYFIVFLLFIAPGRRTTMSAHNTAHLNCSPSRLATYWYG